MGRVAVAVDVDIELEQFEVGEDKRQNYRSNKECSVKRASMHVKAIN